MITLPNKYKTIQKALSKGWNTWNTRSVLQHVLLPEGLAINLAFKQHNWLNEKYLKEALIGKNGKNDEIITPGWHSWNGSFTELHIKWQGVDATIQTAHIDNNLVILISQKTETKLPVKLIIELGMLWNYPGKLVKKNDILVAELPTRTIEIFCTAKPANYDLYVPTMTPYISVALEGEIGISTGKKRTLEEIKSAFQTQKNLLQLDAKNKFGEQAKTFLAIQAGIAWNTIFEPKYKRVVSTVGRLWNAEYGGYCLFGWDNFFLAYMCGLDNIELAIANLIEHITSLTSEGFIPNDDRGNDTKSFDRSQPPVGSIMAWEIYKMHPEKWVLETVFEGLLSWNRWWTKARMNKGLLCYGSHPAQNPFNEPNVHSIITAKYESGMDDSPMYSNVPFNKENNVMELQDVGLNSLYIADCKALANIAEEIGRNAEVSELEKKAEEFSEMLQNLWNEEAGCFLNFRTDLNEFSTEIFPTMFYPLLARIADEKQKEKIIKLFHDPQKLGGDWILPSITRDHPDFPKQRYWKGAIWPPLNFLTWLSFKESGFQQEADKLAEKSKVLFLNEWERKGFVCENYSALSGTGDDDKLSSDSFHSWGSLMGIMKLITQCKALSLQK
jgi:glycogen debranching enzyme